MPFHNHKNKPTKEIYESADMLSVTYERSIARMYYDRLCALCDSKRQELIASGIEHSSAGELAVQYVMTNYCEGHSCAVYAIAQARKQLMREGRVPTNASKMPNPWRYDPYTRLSLVDIAHVMQQNA